ncbi:serine carboxypeptidase-like 7 isoform X1 [Trifolium pratense]|uniref:serine carboxypeptidase-like 7 isoform X1 n=1 Tax=Trifolium pratense TaxID=57577 RepID=UPI001E693A4B|nr:serine carboxypeptidase-like 7 isoform X1 [Trifolium pratense]XP_045820821.1 serine carboxypeptidase-like 7 isoform X1 [Trifolium pratense]XP_045820822.1 serine carboxypeptidase-like 7 isoform X1 [Trifolium pratense]XP_045820823.1 serine carboxypeptidase-like 7 isoform X1 [Trifolium pratense]
MGWRCSCVVVVLVTLMLLLPFMVSSASIVKNLPGFDGDLPFKLETGYIGVGEEAKVQIFYYFVESQRNPFIDPILLWFIGGPGCSALSAFFLENGPLRMDDNYSGNLPKLKLNPYGWTHMLNMIYIDMPVGTGFSYSETQEGYYGSATLWVEHSYTFLQRWFLDHPNFSLNPFYIGCGSYSGIPTGPLVQKVYEGYIAKAVPHINIKGYVIASPAFDTYHYIDTRILYAYHMTLISKELYESLEENCKGNYANIDPDNTKCLSDYQDYSQIVRYINEPQILEPLCITTPGVNQVIQQPVQDDQELRCRSYYNILLNTWANDENVRKALHVREGTKGEFLICNRTDLAYTHDLTNVVEYYLNLTHANLQALVYCSDLDMSIPHIDTQFWIKSFNMSIHDKWRAWFVEGQVAGFTEIYKMKADHYLTYVTVKGAGHVAHRYKPKEVYNMIKRWFSFSLI